MAFGTRSRGTRIYLICLLPDQIILHTVSGHTHLADYSFYLIIPFTCDLQIMITYSRESPFTFYLNNVFP